MTREELLQLIGEVQQAQSELPHVEAKSARGGRPQRLFEPLSAFANRRGGGAIMQAGAEALRPLWGMEAL